jgi:hypothetical protein
MKNATTRGMTMTANPLVEQYRKKIKPLLPLAQKAYGSRDQDTPAHTASREYTRLLTEFYDIGGSLPQLADALGVAYAGVRRRVVMRDVSVATIKPKIKPKLRSNSVAASAKRVLRAKNRSTDEYHDQLLAEYEAGIPLGALAGELGVSSAAPLYYGIQRSMQRSGVTTR